MPAQTILALHNLSPEPQSAELEGITPGQQIAASRAAVERRGAKPSVALGAFGYVWLELQQIPNGLTSL